MGFGGGGWKTGGLPGVAVGVAGVGLVGVVVVVGLVVCQGGWCPQQSQQSLKKLFFAGSVLFVAVVLLCWPSSLSMG